MHELDQFPYKAGPFYMRKSSWDFFTQKGKKKLGLRKFNIGTERARLLYLAKSLFDKTV